MGDIVEGIKGDEDTTGEIIGTLDEVFDTVEDMLRDVLADRSVKVARSCD